MTAKRFTVKPLMFIEEQRNGIFEVGEERLFNNEIVRLLNNLAEENEQLKQFLQSLAEQSVNGKVMLRDGKVYDLNKILKKGDVE